MDSLNGPKQSDEEVVVKCLQLTSESESKESTESDLKFGEEVSGQTTEGSKLSEKCITLTSKRALIAGDVIEDSYLPITKIITKEYIDSQCLNCMKRLDRPKTCSKCHRMSYCNKRCQQMDWKYHKIECKVYSHKKFKFNECFNTEKLLIRLFGTIVSDPSFVEEKHRLSDGSVICLKDIEINIRQLSADIEKMVEFELICNHFKSYGLEFERKQLLIYYGIITFSSFRSSLFYFEDDLIRRNTGVGVFLESYYVKHSCTPNAATVNNGFSQQIRAMKPIAANGEITISYMDLAKDRAERLRTLKLFWYITDCKCIKCQQKQDFDIDYSEFQWSLNKIYSISNVPDLFADSFLPSVNSNHAFNLFSKQTGLYTRIYGPFHPTMTVFLVQQLLAMWKLSKFMSKSSQLSISPVIKEFYDICDTNLKVTYGTDHYYYGLFRKYPII